MKLSLIQGAVMMWILVFITEMIVTGGTAFNPSSGNPFNTLFSMDFTNFSSLVSSFATFIVGCGIWFVAFVKLIFLWSPSVWTGDYIWIWYILFVSQGVAIAFGIVSLIRGVHSS